MKVSGMYYVDVSAEMAVVPEQNPEIKIDERGIIWVKAYKGEKALWVAAEYLKSNSKACEFMVERLLAELQWAGNRAGLSKAEMKRRLLSHMVISK
ncbi:MAG: hypothetical protein WAX33_04395 [Rectinemataceae bacterium]